MIESAPKTFMSIQTPDLHRVKREPLISDQFGWKSDKETKFRYFLKKVSGKFWQFFSEKSKKNLIMKNTFEL